MNGNTYIIGTSLISSGTILMKRVKMSGPRIQMHMMLLEALMLCLIMEGYILESDVMLTIIQFQWELLEHKEGILIILEDIFNGQTSIQQSQDTLITKVGGSQLDGILKFLLLTDGSYTVSLLMFGGSFTSRDTLQLETSLILLERSL